MFRKYLILQVMLPHYIAIGMERTTFTRPTHTKQERQQQEVEVVMVTNLKEPNARFTRRKFLEHNLCIATLMVGTTSILKTHTKLGRQWLVLRENMAMHRKGQLVTVFQTKKQVRFHCTGTMEMAIISTLLLLGQWVTMDINQKESLVMWFLHDIWKMKISYVK